MGGGLDVRGGAGTGAATLPLPSIEGFVIGTAVGAGITVIGAARN